MSVFEATAVSRLPAAGDNAAIAVRDLAAGTRILIDGAEHALSHDILTGHRFAVEAIPAGAALTSWGLPFGAALRDIRPGEVLCNAGVLEALGLRDLDVRLPDAANFADIDPAFTLDETAFQPGRQVSLLQEPGTFEGFVRPGGRGTGTRNHIVILGTTSRTASLARTLAARLASVDAGADFDGVVAVAHTEGGAAGHPNNEELLLRTLAGFMVHPNVGAVLAIDRGTEAVGNRVLRGWLGRQGYPLDSVLHAFHSAAGDLASELRECESLVRGWLEPVAAMRRSQRPMAELKIALQCGGSDAFSGISGNPLAARVAAEVIRHGGAAGLAETDELIGAEPYMLANVRDVETARAFLQRIATFRERVAWHGHSVTGNPTGGNKLRGLYNITLKSVGAARKKDPELRLDHVIDYGQPMEHPGFYFMDSPGNDLESIAGQVASGCNMIFFITGNGSITNFPFVPTLKYMTTTERFNLLSHDMDVNAGRYLDGTPMEPLAAEAFGLTVAVASGQRSAGERARHSQVSIWRDWQQVDGSRLEAIRHAPVPDGRPISVPTVAGRARRIRAVRVAGGHATDQVGLIVPTSLCAGQIAANIARSLSASAAGGPVSRFVALVHTEGCGTSSGDNERLYTRTMAGHLAHPMVREALLLEHGCEHTHNDLMRHELERYGLEPERFGYASIQLDGGIERVSERVALWFHERLAGQAEPQREDAGLETLALALLSTAPVSAPVAGTLARIAAAVAGQGGRVLIPANTPLLDDPGFLGVLGLQAAPSPNLAYGQPAPGPGLFVMETPTDHGVETLTGLGACGAQLMLAHVHDGPLQGHPMVPLLQVATATNGQPAFHRDLDHVLRPQENDQQTLAEALLDLVCAAASGEESPRLWQAGFVDFQVTRGRLGVSL